MVQNALNSMFDLLTSATISQTKSPKLQSTLVTIIEIFLNSILSARLNFIINTYYVKENLYYIRKCF